MHEGEPLSGRRKRQCIPRKGYPLDITIRRDGKEIFHEKNVYAKTFGDVAVGETLVFQDLASYISFSINEGSFFKKYGLEDGRVYDIEMTRPPQH